jgi:hypothetical protein
VIRAASASVLLGFAAVTVVSGFASDRAAMRADVERMERARVVPVAAAFLNEAPVTITASHSDRSAGGLHDFFSEGDYWWTDPANPNGPYIRKDGQSNPANFVEHRRAMVRLSVQVPALTAAWLATHDDRYAAHARRHLRAWFVDEATRMNPSLPYAQAIHGVTTGRGTGIIDTLHLVEVARAVEVLHRGRAMPDAEFQQVSGWFAAYVRWLTTHSNSLEERDTKNNHATTWVLQVAAFASLTGDRPQLDDMRRRYKEILLPGQMGPDGSFPQEIARTKPYSYSLFNLEAMAGICQVLSTPDNNLWTFELPDGRGMKRALAFMAPFIRDKKQWPHPPDVEYDNEWPMRQSSLLFGAQAFDQSDLFSLWKTLEADSQVEEVVRNFFLRQPLLWIDQR